jgi:hypothetical protein
VDITLRQSESWRLANSIASRNPDDEDAQRRAQVATAFIENMGITLQAPTAGSKIIAESLPRKSQHSVKLPIELYRYLSSQIETPDIACALMLMQNPQRIFRGTYVQAPPRLSVLPKPVEILVQPQD